MANENVTPEVVEEFIQALVNRGSHLYENSTRSDGNAYALGYITSLLKNGDFNKDQIEYRLPTLF
jgi:hypothetical protein